MPKYSRAFICSFQCCLIVCSCSLFVFIWVILLTVITDHKYLRHSHTIVSSNTEILRYTSSQSIVNRLTSYMTTIDEYRSKIPHLKYFTPSLDIDATTDGDPPLFPLIDLLTEWNPNDIDPSKWGASRAHPNTGNGLQRLDFQDAEQFKLATILREREVPFVLYNIPDLTHASEKCFSSKNLLKNMDSSETFVVEVSETNKFMYYKYHGDAGIPGWTPPQVDQQMTFKQFLHKADEADRSTVWARNDSLSYLTISANAGFSTPWIREAFPFFDPEKQANSFFVVDRRGMKGINCRFGVKGVIAAAHYDGGRNFVAMLRGRKRYMLLPPSECFRLELLPREHPSARHSSVDWSDLSQANSYPELFQAQATEYVLSQGEMLYIPSYWFHYIVSQDASIQCNARSGDSAAGKKDIKKCSKT